MIILPLVGVVALALLLSHKKAGGGAPASTVPSEVTTAVHDSARGTATASQLRSAALAAAKAGYKDTARVLALGSKAMREQAGVVPAKVHAALTSIKQGAAHADHLREAAVEASRAKMHATAALLADRASLLAAPFQDVEAATAPTATEASPEVKADMIRKRKMQGFGGASMGGAESSPIDGVPMERWVKFARTMVTGKPDSVADNGALGMFRYDPRKLADLGIVEKVSRDGKAWRGNFRAPITAKVFADPRLQAKIFERDMRATSLMVGSRHADQLGKAHAGEPATLSGLMAVAHRAGRDGLASWLANDGDKARFKQTTASYLAVNGLF